MRQHRSVLFLYFLLGAYAVCAQATLLRETQVVLFGSEFSWGLVLACWLAGVAVGAQASGRLLTSTRRSWQAIAASSLAMPLLLAGAIVFLRGARLLLGTGPGEYIGPWGMLLVAAAATAPVSVWVGLAFPAASALLAGRYENTVERARSVGWVYLTEAAGSLVGGALFSLVFVTQLNPVSLVFCGGAVLAAATSYLIRERAWSGTAAGAALLWAAAAATVVLSGAASRLDEASVRLRWRSFAPGLELVDSKDSKYQNIAVGKVRDQFSLYTNGTVVSTWPDHSTLAIEAHLAACQHPAPRRMLVLGGGAEGILKELQLHRPERLDYVTLDRKVLELLLPRLAPADAAAVQGGQTHVHHTDARRFVKRAARAGAPGYDLVLLAGPEPGSALEARLYTAEFFAELSRAMSADGVVALSLTGSVGAWGPETAGYVGTVMTPLEHVFPEVLLTFGDPVWIFAAKQAGVVTGSGDVLAERYRARSISSPYFDPLWFEGASDLLDPEKRALARRALETQPPRHYNSDEKPVAPVYRLRLWLATIGAAHRGDLAPGVRRASVLSPLLRLEVGWVIAALVVCTALGAAVGLARGKGGLQRTALLWSVGTTGCAVMAVEIVLLYTFQVLYGYVYGMVGLVIGIFMFGLVLGSALMNRFLGTRTADRLRHPDSDAHSPRSGLRAMLVLDTSVTAFAIALLGALAFLRASSADLPVQITTFCLVAVVGVLGGLVFPLAASVRLGEGTSTARAAAAVDAADHVGGSLGALATGVALVPILGITGTCLAVAAMKALSALFVTGGIAAGPTAQATPVSAA